MLKSFRIPKLKSLIKTKIEYQNFTKLFLILVIFNFISVLITSELLLRSKIYIPGLYWIPQTISYAIKDINLDDKNFIISFDKIAFYLSCLIINIPLIIFAYFKIDKRYAKLSALSILIWIFWGVFLSFEFVNNNKTFLNWLDFEIDSENLARTQEIKFYILALVIGVFDGIISSFIWKQNLCSGGLDFVFTYFTIKRRREIQKASLPITISFTIIVILVNESNNPDFNFPYFIYFFLNSLILVYSRLSVINVLYPKYKLVALTIITKKGDAVCDELLKFYYHGGNRLQAKGLYDRKNKEIILTTMSHLEKNLIIKKLIKIDPDLFCIFSPSQIATGYFRFL